MNWDIRDWLDQAKALGQLKQINGADWDLEIGCLTSLFCKRENCPGLLFDRIKGYPEGYRLLTASASNPVTLSLTLGLPPVRTTRELLEVVRRKMPIWEETARGEQPRVVKSGPILEKVSSGNEVDLFEFPTPRWHELDGGRYIGTGDAVITRDPDEGWVNLGTYRAMIHDKKTLGIHISPGKHSRIHYEKYHSRGMDCPIAISIGHHTTPARDGRRPLSMSPGYIAGSTLSWWDPAIPFPRTKRHTAIR